MSLRATALASLLALGAIGPSTALAQDSDGPIEGLAWQWNDKELRYHINGSVFVPDWIWLRSLNNLEIRSNEIYMELVTTCGPREPSKKRWEVDCIIDAVGLQAAALPADAQKQKSADAGEDSRLDRILVEWSERLQGETIRTQWSATGRVRSITLPTLDRRNRRDGENSEIIRQVLVRALSPLDLNLPRKGSDKGDRTWSEKEPLLAGFLSDSGSVGNIPTQHTIDVRRGDQVRITSQGAGTVGNAGRVQNVAGTQQIADFFEVEFTTETFFDIGQGHMVRREAIFGGSPTASSSIADGTAGLPYLQTYRVQLIPTDAPPPLVMPSKEVTSSLVPGAAKDKAGTDSGTMPEPTSTLPKPPSSGQSMESLPTLPKPPPKTDDASPPSGDTDTKGDESP